MSYRLLDVAKGLSHLRFGALFLRRITDQETHSDAYAAPENRKEYYASSEHGELLQESKG